MMKKTLYFFLICLCCSSCMSQFHLSSLEFKETSNLKFPTLDILFNEESLVETYGLADQYIYSHTDSVTGEDQYERTLIPSTQFNDFKAIATSFMNQKICNQGPIYHGTIEFKAIARSVNNGSSTITYLIPVFTIGLGYIFGIPSDYQKHEIKIEVIFYNSKGNYITSYSAIGKGKSYKNIYNSQKPNRHANASAIKDALEQINSQIQKEYRYLNEIFSSSIPENIDPDY